jgi:predicted DNA-binding transcriptional regulator AlpA
LAAFLFLASPQPQEATLRQKKKRHRRSYTQTELESRRARRAASLRASTDYTNPLQVLSIDQWRALLGIARSTAHAILNRDDAPPRFRVGKRRVGILMRDHLSWLSKQKNRAEFVS